MSNGIIGKCRWCKNDLNESAKVCAKCGRHQNPLLVRLDETGTLIALVMMGIAMVQLLAAGSERAKAESALLSARTAHVQALENNVHVWENLLWVQKNRMDDLPQNQSSRLPSLARQRDQIQGELSQARLQLKEFQQVNKLDQSK